MWFCTAEQIAVSKYPQQNLRDAGAAKEIK